MLRDLQLKCIQKVNKVSIIIYSLLKNKEEKGRGGHSVAFSFRLWSMGTPQSAALDGVSASLPIPDP